MDNNRTPCDCLQVSTTSTESAANLAARKREILARAGYSTTSHVQLQVRRGR